jgi:hypothetical protein
VADIAIETDDRNLFTELSKIDGAVLQADKRGMDGATILTTVVTLSPMVIGAIVKLVRMSLDARKHVKVTYKGMTIQGVSEETLLRILDK